MRVSNFLQFTDTCQAALGISTTLSIDEIGEIIFGQIQRSLFSQSLYFCFIGEDIKVGETDNKDKAQTPQFLRREHCSNFHTSSITEECLI